MARFEKYTKEECDYGQGIWPEECGTCAHYSGSKPSPRFPEGQGNCYIVQGRIGEHDLCKFHVYAKGKDSLEAQGYSTPPRVSQRQIEEFLDWQSRGGPEK